MQATPFAFRYQPTRLAYPIANTSQHRNWKGPRIKLAILSDIHANSEALEAVLAEAAEIGTDELLILGDLVGYYYWPREVVAAIRDWPHVAIQGNHERILAFLRDDPSQEESLRSQAGTGHSVALRELPPADVDWLVNLPPMAEIERAGTTFLLCHGTPDSQDEYLYPDAPVEDLEHFTEVSADVVLLGHTHYQFMWCGNRTFILNPGSVGQARDQSGLASWLLYDTNNGAVRPFRTAYDVERVIREARKRDPQLPYLVDVQLRPLRQ